MAFDGQHFLFSREQQLALTGELAATIAAADEVVLKAARFALMTVVEEGKTRLRDMVVKAGLAKQGSGSGKGSGRSLASAVRFELYPKTGLARNPAALLYIQPSATKIYDAFEEGATIRSGSGAYLTIPIPNSPADRKVAGDKPRGTTLLAQLRSKGVEIAFVPGRNGKPGMLVAQSVRLRENARGQTKVAGAKRTKSGGFAAGATSVPLFWLVPSARIPKRLDMRREFERVAADFMRAFTEAFAKEAAFWEKLRSGNL